MVSAALLAVALGATAQMTGQMSPTSDVSSNRVKATGSTTSRPLKDIAADVGGNPGSNYYVNTLATFASDSNTCKSWVFPCRSILGAVDKLAAAGTGGNVYISDQSIIGGEVAYQGLWIMGPSDPGWGSAAPAGWRKIDKRIRFIGVGTNIGQFGIPTQAIVWGGQGASQAFGTWGTTYSKTLPAVWLAGANNISFENLNFVPVAIGAYVGVASSGSLTTDSMASNITFRNVSMSIWSEASGTDNGSGPCVRLGHVVWSWWFDTSFSGYYNAPIDDDRHFGMVAGESTFSQAPMLTIKEARWTGGGLRFYVPNSSWGFQVENMIVESDWAHPLPPTVNIKHLGKAGNAWISNAQNADFTGAAAPGVLVEPDATAYDVWQLAEAVTVWGTSVVGPANGTRYPAGYVPDSYPGGVDAGQGSPWRYQQSGFWGGNRIAGNYSGPRRIAAPAAARWVNKVATAPPANPDPAHISTLTYVKDPFGGTKAVRWSTTAPDPGSSVTYANVSGLGSGDRIAYGGWLRVATPTLFKNPYFLITMGGGGTFAGYSSPSGDLGYNATTNSATFFGNEWVFVQGATKVSAAGDGTASLQLNWTSSDGAVDLFVPFLYVAPASESLTDAEWNEWFATMSPTPAETPPGNVGLLPGQAMFVGAAGIFQGSGDPTGVVTASPGSLFLRLDPVGSSTVTSLYVKTSGTGNAGWTAK